MIVYFRVRNFGSIGESLVLDFRASSIQEYSDSHVIEVGKDKLLRTLYLFGPNGSGKSKLMDALVAFRYLTINSSEKSVTGKPLPHKPFLLSQKFPNEATTFEMEFYCNSIKYRYGFSFSAKSIEREWLFETKKIKEYNVFLRNGEDYQIDDSRFPEASELRKRTKARVLFLTVCSKWNVTSAVKIVEWFQSFATIHGLLTEKYREATYDLLKRKTLSNLVVSFIKNADIGISDIQLISRPDDLDQFLENNPDALDFIPETEREKVIMHMKKNPHLIQLVHGELTETGESKYDPFILDDESEGTKKLINIIGEFITSIMTGSPLIMDEFDARFHPLISRSLLEMFNSIYHKSHSQLIATGHDTSIMDLEILRRDQICLLEKNFDGQTRMRYLVEFKKRKGKVHDKYLKGKFGSVPHITNTQMELGKVFNEPK